MGSSHASANFQPISAKNGQWMPLKDSELGGNYSSEKLALSKGSKITACNQKTIGSSLLVSSANRFFRHRRYSYSNMSLLTTDEFNDYWPALTHESWLCRDAFRRFQTEGQRQIAANIVGKEPTRESNIAAYSAYSDFILHLHGTYMALFDMEVYHKHIPAPPKKKGELALAHDNFIRNEACRRQEPKSKVPVPEEFSKDIRDIRNRTGHVDHKRTDPEAAGQLTLLEFYLKYHDPFVDVLFRQIASSDFDRHAAGEKWDAIEGFSVIAATVAQHYGAVDGGKAGAL
jgi:hypothetical protein